MSDTSKKATSNLSKSHETRESL